MLARMFTIENRKLTRRHMFWIEMAALIVAALAMLGLMLMVRQMLVSGVPEGSGLTIEGIDLPQTESYLTWPLSFSFVLSGVYAVGALLVVILAGAVTAQEYTWRSFQLWLSRGVPRWQVLLTKFAAITLATLLIIVATIGVVTLFSGVASLFILDGLPFAAVSWGHLGLSVLAMTLSLLPYAALGLLLAVAARSAVVAIGGGLAFTLLLEPLTVQLLPLLGERWAEATQYLPNALGMSLNGGVSNLIAAAGSMPAAAGASPTTAALLLGGYVALMLGTAVIIFQRQDLGG